MNIISLGTRSRLAVAVFLVAVLCAPTAHAADLGDWGWNDYGTYDTWGDYGSYDTWNDYGTYDDWSDYGTYDDWSDYGTYGYNEDSSYPYSYSEDASYPYGYSEDSSYPYSYSEDSSYAYGSEYFDEIYYDEACSCYSMGGSGGRSGGGYSVGGRSYQPAYSSGGYSMVKPISFSPPQYSYPKPTGGGSNTNITNTNTNTNINNTNTTITNIDNSINDSFNNYNSNNVAYVAPATPQYPVVYTPNYPVYQTPYCVIKTAQGSGSYQSGSYLAWSSSNATSAYLTNIGSVPATGTYTVYPTVTTTYTLTVYGQGGQMNTCQVTVYANNTTPYVSLEQIPYTGFDLGTYGNAMYFAVLFSFAAGLAYLAIYYRGGALAFASVLAPARRQYAPVLRSSKHSLLTPKAPILIEKEMKAAVSSAVAPIVEKIRKAGTTDTMAIVQSRDGSMPKIVIERY